MNKTKKRAHKRAQDKAREAYVQKLVREGRRAGRYRRRTRGFTFPFPLTTEFKIKNLKAIRDHMKCGLAEAKRLVEAEMLEGLL